MMNKIFCRFNLDIINNERKQLGLTLILSDLDHGWNSIGKDISCRCSGITYKSPERQDYLAVFSTDYSYTSAYLTQVISERCYYIRITNFVVAKAAL
jgi:hypothetical protein